MASSSLVAKLLRSLARLTCATARSDLSCCSCCCSERSSSKCRSHSSATALAAAACCCSSLLLACCSCPCSLRNMKHAGMHTVRYRAKDCHTGHKHDFSSECKTHILLCALDWACLSACAPLMVGMCLLQQQLAASQLLLQLLAALPCCRCFPPRCIYLLQGLGHCTAYAQQAAAAAAVKLSMHTM